MNRFLWIAVFTWGCVTDVAPVADTGAPGEDDGVDAAPSVMQTLDAGSLSDGGSTPRPDGPMDPNIADAEPPDQISDAEGAPDRVQPDAADLPQPDASAPDPDAGPMDMAVPDVLYDPLPVCINEFAAKVSGYGSDGPLDWIELFNPTQEDINLDGWHISDDPAAPEKHAFGALFVPAGGAIVLYADTQPDRGPAHLPFKLAAGGEDIILTAPDGRAQRVSYGALPVDVTPARTPDCCSGDDCWRLDFLGTPGRGNVLARDEELTLIEPNSAWRYFIGEVGEGWQLADYDARGWGEGGGPLGWGDDHIETQIERPGGVITAYFRKSFELESAEGLQEAVFTLLVDDGAVVYLNGEEVIRARMPEGEIRPNTLARETAGGPAETVRTPYPLPVDRFRPGMNLLAVEVHQAAPNSSDLGFDGALQIRRTEPAEPAPPADPSPDLVRTEQVPIPDDINAWLFERSVIHRVALTLPPASVEALTRAPQTLAVGELHIDGRRIPEVGVRLSDGREEARPLEARPHLHVDFDHFAPERGFFRLTSLALNNSVSDCSRMREFMASQIFAAAGLPAPRAAFAEVSINGEPRGLYVLLETEDQGWLDRHYPAAGGQLYDGRSVIDGRGEAIQLDFEQDLVPRFTRIAGDGRPQADLFEVANALAGNAGQPTFYDAVGEVVDWENFHRHAAAEIWTGHGLGYVGNRDNYRVYFDPANEKMDFAPWGLQHAFHPEGAFGCGFEDPCGLLAQLCWGDEDCLAAQRTAIVSLDETLADQGLVDAFDAADELTRRSVLAGLDDECSREAILEGRVRVRAWLETRSEAILDRWSP